MSGDFSSPQWRRLTAEILERDGYRCRVRGPKCKGTATQTDHIVPVEDGGAMFDPTNLRAACQWCNTWRAQQQKSRDGWKRARTYITLVTGPDVEQVSGYVRERSGPADLVIDWTALMVAVGNNPEEVQKVRGSLLSRVRRGESGALRAWITSCNPKAREMFPYHEIVSWWPEATTVVREW